MITIDLISYRAMKLIFSLSIAVGLIAGLVFAFIGYQYVKPPVFSSTSPDRRFRVDLFGNLDAPEFPFIMSTIEAEVIAEGRKLSRVPIHFADPLEGSFNVTYRELRWSDDNVFGLYGLPESDFRDGISRDSITITNNANRNIGFLKVRFGGNQFFIFDLKSNRNQAINLTQKSRVLEYVHVSGEFDSGTEIRSGGINFDSSDKQPSRYCVTIDEGGTRINSVDLQGWTLNPDKIIVPAVKACGD
ncbi:MAG: hypothetical protein IPG22_19820 [Acidobacteria bacterium]|nr:hypothetical protein [Acidobacteriota bacterium]